MPGSSLEYLVLFELVVCCLVLKLFGAYRGVLDLGVYGGCLLRQLLLFVVLTPGVDLLLRGFQP